MTHQESQTCKASENWRSSLLSLQLPSRQLLCMQQSKFKFFGLHVFSFSDFTLLMG